MTFGVIARELGQRRSCGDRLPAPARRPAFDRLPGVYAKCRMPGLPIPGYGLLRLGLPAGRTLRRRWKAERPDLVHVATEGPLGASAVTAARRLGIPVTSSFHTNFHAYARHYGIGPVQRLALAWLRRVHNRTLRTFAADRGARRGARGARLPRFGSALAGHRHPAVPARAPVRGAPPGLGRGAGRSGRAPCGADGPGEELSPDFPGLRPRCARPIRACRCVLAGDGPLEARLRREHPEAIFIGFLPREELARHYASADIYVHASLTETFGNVLTEAMASGLAVADLRLRGRPRSSCAMGRTAWPSPATGPRSWSPPAVRLATDAAAAGPPARRRCAPQSRPSPGRRSSPDSRPT